MKTMERAWKDPHPPRCSLAQRARGEGSESSVVHHLRRILDLHFDPEDGAPYWLERQEELGFDVRSAVRRPEDLLRLGPMREEDLATRPLTDFLPRPVLACRDRWVVAETGGTLGRPKTTLWLEDELQRAFVEPFTAVARGHGFPQGAGWLFAGPTGPHVIGRAARENARALGAAEPFRVDFDPRWAKKLPAGSLGARRYLRHVVDQARGILDVQDVSVLFSTPSVLLALADELSLPRRAAIRGVFYGGQPLEPEAYSRLRRAFPRAVHLAGYGNSLVGLALQLAPSEDGRFRYFYPGPRVLVRLVERGTAENAADRQHRLHREVEPGDTGQVVVSRLDPSFLIVNLFERDEAERLAVPGGATPFPIHNPGLGDPRPLTTLRPVAAGLY